MISYAPLRELLKQRHISTYYLRNKCGSYNLDSKTIKRLQNDESVSTNTINALCHILHCDIKDIIEYIPNDEPNDN